MEFWTGHAPDYSNLRAFGCAAYAHIKLDRLQPRALKCIFMGYPEGVKGYRLWCIEAGNQKCIISRDVVFNENDFTMNKSVRDAGNKIEDLDSKFQMEIETMYNQSNENLEAVIEVATLDKYESSQYQQDYCLTRDRKRREIKPSCKFGFAYIIAYAFSVLDQR